MEFKKSCRRFYPLVVSIFVLLILLACSGSDTEIDDQAPPAPGELTVDINVSGDGVIEIFWMAPEDNDVVGYHIYRAENTPSSFIKIDSTLQIRYRDTDLEYETTYYYYVTSFDAVGNESEPSDTVHYKPININYPAAPNSLKAVAHNRIVESFAETNIVLTWSPNSENDFYCYVLYRDTIPSFTVINNSSAVVDTIFSISTISYIDNSVIPGTSYYYRLTAVDKGGLVSNASNLATDTPLKRPELYAPVNDQQVSSPFNFSWESLSDPENQQIFYQIRLSSTLGGDAIWTKFVSNQSGSTITTAYDGPALNVNTRYYWKVLTYTQSDTSDYNSNSDLNSFFYTQ